MVCANSRDIRVADTAAKDFNAHLRSRLFPLVEAYARSTQCGGIRRRGTDFALHFARAHWAMLTEASLSGAQLYVDITAAFASLVR